MMKVIQGRNIREIYKIGMEYLKNSGREEESRAGKVIVAPCPVMSVYERPWERVITNKGRDANPFFHFFEGIWMLSGGRDGSFLNQFVSDFTSRFADKDPYLNGAYGHRWRHHFFRDQIKDVAETLKFNKDSRRCVINMWDPTQDWYPSKDIPCNTSLFFRVSDNKLHMMTNCRSNDIIWGAYGANAVHMTMLQEYLAAAIGVKMGLFYQNSWNYHAYVNVFQEKVKSIYDGSWYDGYEESLAPLVSHPDVFLYECEEFVAGQRFRAWKNTIFQQVALPMWESHVQYKQGAIDTAIATAETIDSADWRKACTDWLYRRGQKAVRKDAGEVDYESGVDKEP